MHGLAFIKTELDMNPLILPQTLDHAYTQFLVVEILHCKVVASSSSSSLEMPVVVIECSKCPRVVVSCSSRRQ